ncbi:hypothetical protein BJ508DRAFT_378657 [Ascobolus immersus RN42]|uniref:Uncharacterized protein n=1 Tax=Ascobolus immersus RN42 TaxID=1160509 RepID=A0A3N4HVL7_ASCIM|nr:hypothetical protein BJ508DRAFT_378657 [Ascobolus immersus RN42]
MKAATLLSLLTMLAGPALALPQAVDSEAELHPTSTSSVSVPPSTTFHAAYETATIGILDPIDLSLFYDPSNPRGLTTDSDSEDEDDAEAESDFDDEADHIEAELDEDDEATMIYCDGIALGRYTQESPDPTDPSSESETLASPCSIPTETEALIPPLSSLDEGASPFEMVYCAGGIPLGRFPYSVRDKLVGCEIPETVEQRVQRLKDETEIDPLAEAKCEELGAECHTRAELLKVQVEKAYKEWLEEEKGVWVPPSKEVLEEWKKVREEMKKDVEEALGEDDGEGECPAEGGVEGCIYPKLFLAGHAIHFARTTFLQLSTSKPNILQAKASEVHCPPYEPFRATPIIPVRARGTPYDSNTRFAYLHVRPFYVGHTVPVLDSSDMPEAGAAGKTQIRPGSAQSRQQR